MRSFVLQKRKISLFVLSAGLFFCLFLIIFSFYLIKTNSLFQTNKATAASSDVIAVRVVKNNGYLSALNWFEQKDFSGSPQLIEIDGYRAIRAGRTVYVNAANIDSNKLYTNIYIISYNQDAGKETIDIFSKILESWHFNINVSDNGNCAKRTEINCRYDSDCPTRDYCDSDKAKVTRDVRRLEIMAETKERLSDYAEDNGHFPTLSAGTYLPNVTLSTWPSWEKTLAHDLGSRLYVDPINQLGDCSNDPNTNYNKITCWDEETQSFADPVANTIVDLPDDSFSIMYVASSTGIRYDLCAVMESGLVQGMGKGACRSSSKDQIRINVAIPNGNPIINDANFNACIGHEFNGYISASDPDNDVLTWTITQSNGVTPSIVDTSNNKRKIINILTIGSATSYTFSVLVDDGRGASASADYIINTKSCEPPVIQTITDTDTGIEIYNVNNNVNRVSAEFIIGQNINLKIIASDKDTNYPLTYHFDDLPAGFNTIGFLNTNEHDYTVRGQVIDQTTLYNAQIQVQDALRQWSDIIFFDITVINNPPMINSLFNTTITGCVPYTPANNMVNATDPDGHTLEYIISGLPRNLVLNNITGIVTGEARVQSSDYSANLIVQDNYFNFTNPLSNAQATDNITIAIVDDIFTVDPPIDLTFYTYPTGLPDNSYIHHQQFSYNASPVTNPNGKDVTWSMTTEPALLSNSIDGFNITINPDTGQVSASAIDSEVDSGGVNFAVTVSAITDYCQVEESATFNVTLLQNEWCGDDISQGGYEECDDGRNGREDDECTDQCRDTYCGDSIRQTPNGNGLNEICDDVSSQCDIPPLAPNSNGECTRTFCGDGEVQILNGEDIIEECDDGNDVDGDGCNTISAGCQYVCGDGHPDDGEDCDDGNNIDGDGCNTISANCQHVCGDGHLDDGEDCDDGNDIDGDKCNTFTADCQYVCGDGLQTTGEDCDGTDLNNHNCFSYDSTLYLSGPLSCKNNCTFDKTGCVPIKETFSLNQWNCANIDASMDLSTFSQCVLVSSYCGGGGSYGKACFGTPGVGCAGNINCPSPGTVCLGSCYLLVNDVCGDASGNSMTVDCW